MLVTLKFPPLNVLVAIEVQFVNASATFVLVSTSYASLATPFVPLITKFVPDRLMPVMCGFDPTVESTWMKPEPPRKYVFQVSPGESDGRFVAVKEPPKLPLNRLKLSPTCSGFPVFVTVSVPPNDSVVAVIKSALAGEFVRLIFRKVVPASAKLPEKFNVPIELVVPGATVPLAVTLPLTFPLPLKV